MTAVAGTPILGVTADDTNVYATAENKDTGGYPVVIAVSIADRTRLEEGWPATLEYPNYVDSETNGQFVIIAHGGDNVSKVDVTTGSAIQSNDISSADCTDVDADALAVLLACGGGIVKFNTSTNDLSIVLGFRQGLVRGQLTLDERARGRVLALRRAGWPLRVRLRLRVGDR